MSQAPTLSAILPYFGGKRTLAPRIVAELGPHQAYWELFAGSMAVLLAKPPCSMETVNDLYGEVVNLARVMRDETLGPMLYRRLRRRMMSEVEFEEADWLRIQPWWKPDDGTPNLPRAEMYFLASWTGRGGMSGTLGKGSPGYAVRYTKNGGHGAKRFAGAVESIPAFRRRLRQVTILNRDAFDTLERIEDAAGVVIYLDPPYLVKGASYVHDFTEADHLRLRDAAARFTRTRVVISYYDHPLLREWYAGWTLVECPTTKSMVSAGRRDQNNAVKAPEILLINGPSLTDPGAITLPALGMAAARTNTKEGLWNG